MLLKEGEVGVALSELTRKHGLSIPAEPVAAVLWTNLRLSNSVSSKTPLAYRRDDSDKLLPCNRTNRAASASAKRGPPS